MAHLALLASGSDEDVVAEHVRQSGAAGTRMTSLSGRVGIGPVRLRAVLDGLQRTGQLLAVDRDWYLHPESLDRLQALVVAALEQFHRANPLRPGCRARSCEDAREPPTRRCSPTWLGALQTEGALVVERDKVWLASHEIRLSATQQRALAQVEEDFLKAGPAPPSPEEALGRAGLHGGEEHELFQLLLDGRRLVRVKESLFFHAAALDAIQGKLVALLTERKDIGPADIKDLLGISRKYAIPLLEYFDGRRVTARVGERRVLRGG